MIEKKDNFKNNYFRDNKCWFQNDNHETNHTSEKRDLKANWKDYYYFAKLLTGSFLFYFAF